MDRDWTTMYVACLCQNRSTPLWQPLCGFQEVVNTGQTLWLCGLVGVSVTVRNEASVCVPCKNLDKIERMS